MSPKPLLFALSSKQVLFPSNSAFFNHNFCIRRKMSLKDIREIFLKSVEAVRPEKLIEKHVRVHQNTLTVRGETYHLNKPCYVVGFGKAVLGMAIEIERALGDRLKRAIVTVPAGIFENFAKPVESKVEFVEGAKDNLPDEMAMRGAIMIKELVVSLTGDDLLIVLISGGGSALLPLPIPPITLKEKQELIRTLAKRGATINELNTVRKRLSLLKGGGLAELAHPCRVVSLVLSDIVGDPLDLIASGPTMPNSDRPGRALEVLRKYRLESEVGFSRSIEMVLKRGGEEVCGSRVAISNGEYEHVRTHVIGNNRIAAEAAKQEAIAKGYQSFVVSTRIEGDVRQLGKIYANMARQIAAAMADAAHRKDLEAFLEESARELRAERSFARELLGFDLSKGVCLIFAGEPTVVVTGTGKGGRNQHLALTVAATLGVLSADVSFLSCGTDGIDGPTDAAGAVATPGTLGDSGGVRPDEYLENNDAYGFYEGHKGGEELVKIGHTGTNVMDVHVMLVVPK